MIAEISPANYGRARAATPTTVRIGGTEPVQYRALGKFRGQDGRIAALGQSGREDDRPPWGIGCPPVRS